MKTLFIFALVVEISLSVKVNHLLQQNQNNKFGSVCNECQETVQRFNKASKDPVKMIVMKKMLSALCHETNYEEECEILVDKIDFFVEKFSSYLNTPQTVCNKFNMCSNSHIDGLHRIGVLLAKRFMNKIDGSKNSVCDECQFASSEILEVIDDHNMQAQIHDFVSNNLCTQISEYQQTCNSVLNDFLPTLFQEFHNMFSNSKQFCVDLKFCSAHQVNLPRLTANDVKNKLMGPKYVQNLLKSFQAIKMPEPHNLDSMSCGECQILADITLDQLKTSSWLKTLKDALKGILCVVLPLPPEFGCPDFVETYGTTVVYMTLEQFDSESLCELLKMCTNESSAQYVKLAKANLSPNAKCSNCETLSNFLTVEMNKPKAKTEIVYGLQHMACKEAPTSLHNLCETFVGGLLPATYDKFLYYLQNKTVCKTIKAC